MFHLHRTTGSHAPTATILRRPKAKARELKPKRSQGV
jgi:hypothetical protein